MDDDIYRPTGKRAGAAVTTLWAVALFNLVWVVLIVTRFEITAFPAYFDLGSFRLATVPCALAVLVFLCAITFCAWFYKAYANLYDLNATAPTHTPMTAVTTFFLPVANLILPYRAVKETWLKSAPEYEQRGASSRKARLLLPVWWLSFLAGVFIGNAEDDALFVIGRLLTVTAAVAAVAIIFDIESRQRRRQASL